VLGNALPELGTSGVTLAGTGVLGAKAFGVPAMAAWALSRAAFEVEVEVSAAATGCDAVASGICLLATVAEAAVAVDGKAIGLRFVIPGGTGLDVGAFPDGAETGAGATGEDVGGVDVAVGSVGVGVMVGSVGDETEVGLRFVIPGGSGLDVGALPVGEETGAGATGDDVGVVDVWVGSTGEATGVAGPLVGAEVGDGGETGVGVGIGGCAPAVAGTASKRSAFPFLSTATQDAPEMHETAFRWPRRSSSVGVDHAEPLYVR
jgi:hypothetical protein